jgi:hypothetical protein
MGFRLSLSAPVCVSALGQAGRQTTGQSEARAMPGKAPRSVIRPGRRAAGSCGWSRLETLLACPYKRICALKTIRAAPGQVEHAKPGNDGKQHGAITSAVQSHCLFRELARERWIPT